MGSLWVVDETAALSEADADEAGLSALAFESGEAQTPIAVIVHDVFVRSTHRLFGPADVRLDAIAVTVPAPDGSTGLYAPQTFRFPSVKKGSRLPIDRGGLLLYLGEPRYFLDLAIMAAPADDDAPDLADIIRDNSKAVSDATSALAALAMATPQAVAIGAAAAAAGTLASLALRLLQQHLGKTIGLYRTTWFEHRDGFGMGRHPDDGLFITSDLQFWYDVMRDAPSGRSD